MREWEYLKQNKILPSPQTHSRLGDGSVSKVPPMCMSLSSKPDMVVYIYNPSSVGPRQVNPQELAGQLAKITRFSRFSPCLKK